MVLDEINKKKVVSSLDNFFTNGNMVPSIDTPFVRIKNVQEAETKDQFHDQQCSQRNPEYCQGFNR
jgi:hypothetical protein